MKIAEPTIERLLQYRTLLAKVMEEDGKIISSQEIGELLGIKGSQVRKDLSHFGEIGKRGVGYNAEQLYSHIDTLLGSTRIWKTAIAGVGHLGTALIGHAQYESRKFKFSVEALFDIAPDKVGTKISGIDCYHVDDIGKILAEKGIEVLVIASPDNAAQHIVDNAVQAKTLKGILSFTSATIIVPKDILVLKVNVFAELEKLFFYLKLGEEKQTH